MRSSKSEVGRPQVVATVGSASRPEHLAELLDQSSRVETLDPELVEELFALQRRWSDEVDLHAEPWSM